MSKPNNPDTDAAMAIPTVDVRSRSASNTATDPTSNAATNNPPWNNGDPILTLPHDLTIRHFLPSDASTLAEHCNNPSLAINMRDRFPQPYTLHDAETWIALNLDQTTPNWQTPFSLAWDQYTDFPPPQHQDTVSKIPTNYLICHSSQPVGAVGLIFGTDINRRTAEIGYWLAQSHWNKKIMSLVIPRFVAWTFKTFPQIIRLEAGTYGWNEASAKVLLRAGFVEEGRQRCAVWKNGKIGDLKCWGLVREGVLERVMGRKG